MKTKISQWARSLAAIAAVLILAGCGGMTLPGDPGTVRDIIDIRQNVARNSEILDRMESKLTYSIDASEKNNQNNTQIVQSAVESMNQQLREQQKLIEDMRNQMINMNEMLAQATGRRLNPTAGTGAGTEVPPSPASEDAPRPMSGTSPIVSAFNTGVGQFNAGNYPAALESFRLALGQSPTPDQRIEIQYWQAVTFQKAGDTKAAEDAFLALIRDNKTEPRAWDAVERVAEVYRQIKNYDMALNYYNLIVEKYPDYPNIARVKTAIEQVKAEKAGGAPVPGN